LGARDDAGNLGSVADVQPDGFDRTNVQKSPVMNCWEFKECGREEGGDKARVLGICPAYARRAGEACWFIAGTFCGGKVQGTSAQKLGTCVFCDFFQQFDLEHRFAMWKRFH
jgi:hypothetical protein